jgi:hypothetical protein
MFLSLKRQEEERTEQGVIIIVLSLDQAAGPVGGRDTNQPLTSSSLQPTCIPDPRRRRRKEGWKPIDCEIDSVDPTHRPTCLCLYPSTGVDLHELPFSRKTRRRRRGRRRRSGVRYTTKRIDRVVFQERAVISIACDGI